MIFCSAACWHAQYIASNEEGRSLGAVDGCLGLAISQASQESIPFFSLGISNEPVSNELNHSLYKFKKEFGGGGVVHETLVWEFA